MSDALKIGAVLYALWFLTRKPAQPVQPERAAQPAAPKPLTAAAPVAATPARETPIVAASHIQVKP